MRVPAGTLVCLLACAAVAGCSRRREATKGDAAAPAARPVATDRIDGADGGPSAGTDLVRDPFCGVLLRPDEAAARAVHAGTTYHFCLDDHRDAFLADPERALRRLP